ncbi:DUF262 domain-containing protein [Vibrio alginolyticus]|nr:DUF262 domain-containing protein [Vibrio alginolyticus]
MAIENIDRTVNQIYKDVSDKTMVLPRFQRGFVWPRDKQANLVASFLVSLPFGSLLCLNGNRGDFITRELCYTTIIDDASDSVDYILDGQQRLSTLRSVVYDTFEEGGIKQWKDTWEKLYSTLRTRWFLRVKPDDEEDDVFGFKRLQIPTIANFTDSDIVDFVEHRAIHKTKNTDLPYHPAFDKQIANANAGPERVRLKKERKNYFAKEGLIPLYDVYRGESGLHRDVIELIADERLEALKDTLNEEVTPKSIYEHFKFYDGAIASFDDAEELYYTYVNVEDGEIPDLTKLHEKLNDMWAAVKANWVQKLIFELSRLTERRIPIVRLDQSETNRAIAIFEAINKGGVGLSVFDLTVAKAASIQGSDLVSSISEQLTKVIDVSTLNPNYKLGDWKPESMGVIDGDEPTKQFKEWFVNTLSLYIHCNVNSLELQGPAAIKREAILSLGSSEINDNASLATKGIARALAFLNLRCGLIKAQDMPFKLVLVVLAHFLADDEIWSNSKQLNKLEYWYWIAMLSGQYTYRQNEQCIEDIKKLKSFLNKDENAFAKGRDKILNFHELDLDILLRTDQDANTESNSIKSLLLQYVLSRRPHDFRTQDKRRLTSWEVTAGNYTVEIHHIVPLTGATTIEQSTKQIRKESKHILNSLMNMTYISREANQAIKDRQASDYLGQLASYDCQSHMIDSSTLSSNFDKSEMEAFVRSRYVLLTQSISQHLDNLV